MNRLQLVRAVRPSAPNRTARHYLDFSVSGQSLKELLGVEGTDLIGPLGWGDNKDLEHLIKVFRLEERSKLKSGRVMIYVCPECGDIDCGAITATIEDLGDRIVWKNFGFETDYDGISEEYTHLEPIEFERESYFQAFSRL